MLKHLSVWACIAALPVFVVGDTYASHFQKWYPQFHLDFEQAQAENCSSQFDTYLHGTVDPKHAERLAAAFITCMLNSQYVNEGLKANMGTASVLLGLLPLTLQQLGSTTLDTAHVGMRRPFLALLLSIGSPAVAPVRGWEYTDPRAVMKKGDDQVRFSNGDLQKSFRWKSVILLIEYLAVLAAVANVLQLALELGTQTFSSWASRETYTVFIWTFLAMIIHIFSTVSLNLRMSIERIQSVSNIDDIECESTRSRSWYRLARIRKSFATWFREEFTLSRDQSPANLILLRENNWFLFLSWFTATGTVLHGIYGTLILSSLLFISVQDSLVVVVRYVASAVLCRALVMYEIDGVRHVQATMNREAEAAALLKVDEVRDPQDKIVSIREIRSI